MRTIIIHVPGLLDLLRTHERYLGELGVDPDDLIRLAFGCATLTLATHTVSADHSRAPDFIQAVTTILNERPSALGHSVYGRQSREVFYLVDLIGQISQILTNAVTYQLGPDSHNARLMRMFGPDLQIQFKENLKWQRPNAS